MADRSAVAQLRRLPSRAAASLDERLRARWAMRSLVAPPVPPVPTPIVERSVLAPLHPPADPRWTAVDQTSPDEQAWLIHHLSTAPRRGAVVELGTWMGGATTALAEGLRRSPGREPTDRVHTFDRFELHDQVSALRPLDGVAYTEGASFRSLVEERLRPVRDLVEIHATELDAATWDGGPIELLLQDAAKTWSTWRAIRRTFYRALRPGSIVVEQDFGHALAPWIHLSHWEWRHHLRCLGPIPASTSVVFEVVEPLPTALLDRDDHLDAPSARSVQAAFEWAVGLVPEWLRPDIRSAPIVLYHLHGDPGLAADQLLEVSGWYGTPPAVLDLAAELGAAARAGTVPSALGPRPVEALAAAWERHLAGVELHDALAEEGRRYLLARRGHPIETRRHRDLDAEAVAGANEQGLVHRFR